MIYVCQAARHPYTPCFTMGSATILIMNLGSEA
jgi:hypothetical protein